MNELPSEQIPSWEGTGVGRPRVKEYTACHGETPSYGRVRRGKGEVKVSSLFRSCLRRLDISGNRRAFWG